MISFLKGVVTYKRSDSIVMDVNGVGYFIYIPSTANIIINQDKRTIFTYLYVREDRMVLYGFLTKNERDFFKLLIDTPGIGPKVAMNVIAQMGPGEFQYAVLKEDLDLISSISGIGIKLAKKIILELKEKLKSFQLIDDFGIKDKDPKDLNDFVYDAIEALKSLGYPEKEAKQRITAVIKKMKNDKPLTVEDLIKYALNKDSGVDNL